MKTFLFLILGLVLLGLPVGFAIADGTILEKEAEQYTLYVVFCLLCWAVQCGSVHWIMEADNEDSTASAKTTHKWKLWGGTALMFVSSILWGCTMLPDWAFGAINVHNNTLRHMDAPIVHTLPLEDGTVLDADQFQKVTITHRTAPNGTMEYMVVLVIDEATATATDGIIIPKSVNMLDSEVWFRDTSERSNVSWASAL